MQMEIIARHFTLGEEQREVVEAALEKLERFSPRPVQSVKVTVTHDAGSFEADGVLLLRNRDFRAGATGREPEIAVNEMVENLRVQLTKFKGKLSSRQKSGTEGLGKAMGEAGPPPEGDDSPRTFEMRTMTVDEARDAYRAGSDPFLVFLNADNGKVAVVYGEGDGDVGHMEAGQ